MLYWVINKKQVIFGYKEVELEGVISQQEIITKIKEPRNSQDHVNLLQQSAWHA